MTPRTTVAAIMEASGLGRRSIENMRTLLRRRQARFGSKDPFSDESIPAPIVSYQEAVAADRGGERPEFTEEMKAVMIDQMTQALGKALGKQAHRHPEMFGEALRAFLGEDRLRSVNEALGFFEVDPEEFDAMAERGE